MADDKSNRFDEFFKGAASAFGTVRPPTAAAANDASLLTQALPNPGPCADRETLALWFKLFARDCRAALPAAAA